MNRKLVSLISFFVMFAIFGALSTSMLITNVPNTYFPKDLESRILNDHVRETFGTDELMLIVFKDNSQASVEKYRKYEKLFESLKRVKHVKDVTSLFNFEHIKADEEGFSVANILDLDKFSDFEKNLARDENVRDFLINENSDVISMVLEPEKIEDSIKRLKLENEVRKVIDDSGLSDQFFGFGGQFVIDTAQFSEMMDMMKKIVPITFVLGMIILYLLFSNIKFVALAMLCNGLVTQFCLALFAVIGWPYNMVSSMIPSLMMALTIAFMVHLLNAIKSESNNDDSVLLGLSKVKKPSLYSAVTTAIGLFMLYTSPIPPIGHIGIIGGLGVLFSYVVVFEIAPYIMLYFKNPKLSGFEGIDNFLQRINDFFVILTKNHYKLVCASSLIVLLALIPPIYNVKSESNLFKFFDDDHIVNVVNRFFQDEFVGTTSIDIVYKSEDVQSLMSSKFLNDIYKLQKEVSEHQHITRTFSHVDVVKQLHRAFNNDSPDDVIPSDDMLIEQYTLIYDGSDMYDFITRDFSLMRINLALNVQGANEIEKVMDEITPILDKYKYKYSFTGQGKLMSDQENLLISGVLKSLGFSLVIIFFLLVVLWRSPVDALLSMIPNISPVLAGFAFMGILGVWLDFGTAMIASITVGIAVDDTIHMYHSIKSKLMKGIDIDEAIEQSYRSSGTAILMTTIILCSQFSLLMMSTFTPLKNFGFLTSIGLVAALLFDMTFLPAFMKLICLKKPGLLGLSRG